MKKLPKIAMPVTGGLFLITSILLIVICVQIGTGGGPLLKLPIMISVVALNLIAGAMLVLIHFKTVTSVRDESASRIAELESASVEHAGQKDKIAELENKLKEVEDELEQTRWKAEISNKLVNIIEANRNIQDLSDATIQTLATELGASQGAFFVLEKSKTKKVMKLTSGYAYSVSEGQEVKFEVGEGLVGQVAQEGQLLKITDVPEGYIEVVSGLGKTSPTNLILVPVGTEKNVLGVIELASFQEFNDSQIDLLKGFSRNLGTKLEGIL